MIYGYARDSVTTGNNTMDEQEAGLKKARAEVIYKDTFEGAKRQKPELEKLVGLVKEGDTIIITRLDIVASSIPEGVRFVKNLFERGVSVYILNIGLVDRSQTGLLILKVMMELAAFERDIIVQRTQEGKAIARKKKGYKEGRPRTDQGKIDHAIYLHLHEMESLTNAAKEAGISRSTLCRALAEKKMTGSFTDRGVLHPLSNEVSLYSSMPIIVVSSGNHEEINVLPNTSKALPDKHEGAETDSDLEDPASTPEVPKP